MDLCLEVKAPFATFRTFTAGSYRPTAPFMTPSAAYGLLLNLAGIDMRLDDGKSPMTLIKDDLPAVTVALGALSFPTQHSLYQQLHNYPVGASGKEHAPKTKGTKYNIVPARRALLSGLHAYIALRDSGELIDWISAGLRGERNRQYGLPFLGDNNFLPDKIIVVEQLVPAYWYSSIRPEDSVSGVAKPARLTVMIDRVDMSKTLSALYVPTAEPSSEIPESAWTHIAPT